MAVSRTGFEGISVRNPFSALPPCAPNITDPGSADNREATFRATSACCSSSNKWKNADVWMAERRPIRGARLVNSERGGSLVVVTTLLGSSGTKLLSKISPGRNTAGNFALSSLKS